MMYSIKFVPVLYSNSKPLLQCRPTIKFNLGSLFWFSQKNSHVSQITKHNHGPSRSLSSHDVNILSTSKCSLTINLSRSFHQTPSHLEKNERPLPRVLYWQNPLIWATNKLGFILLKQTWDPQFNEAEFRRGTKQAVSVITKFVSQNMFIDLKGLLTKPALIALQHDVETKWSDEQRRLIGLDPKDIRLVITRRVWFEREEEKFCKVDMAFVGMKWMEHGGANAIIFVELISSFRRYYGEGQFPEWTVSSFEVMNFDIVPR